ncbi:MAG TPA: iron-sulfur cluster-binding domain-containing protein [Puia sp.]|nr:iron-sulfur cluster-binding domain-containing protein [Puia sp.]
MDRLELTVTDIIQETRNARTFVLEPEREQNLSYQAGQFITFIFERHGQELRRSYSFSSTPRVDPFHSITVKRVANGEFSRFFTDKVEIDQQLLALGPSGRFTLEMSQERSRQIFFIAAGSGIVPVYSLIKQVIHDEPYTRIQLIYQNHSQKEVIFARQLANLAHARPTQFRLISLITDTAHGTDSKKLNIPLLEILVRRELLESQEHLFFLCGPASFMRMAQFTLRWMGFPEESIRRENFTVMPFQPPAPEIFDPGPKNLLLHYKGNIIKLEAAAGKNILQAALDRGIELPFSCRTGVCSTCAAKCLRGQVKMSNNEVLTESDLQAGLVLTCVGYAETDVELVF